MSMSARQLFLANLASRRFDESDSDGDGSSANDDDDDDGSDASSGDGDDANIYEQNDEISLADQLLKVTPPRNDAVVSALFRAKSHSSLLRKQINCVNINSAETNKSTPTPTEAQVEHKPTMTMAVIPQVPSSPLLRRAESFRRKASDRQNNKVDTNNNNHPIRHVRSFSHDTNARRMVHLHRPSIHELDSKLLSNSLSMSSSFTDLNDDISAVTSVISTASIKSLHSRTTTTTTTTTAPQKQMANNIVQSRREHLPRRPSTMGAGAATSKSFVKSRPADIHNMDDTSTVATEAITSFSGSLSLSHSKSFESSTSKGSSSTRSKELERLKRLSIGGIKRSNSVCDAKDEIIGGYEVQVNMARSDDVSENVSEGSSSVLTSRGREQLHRMKKSTQTNNNPPNSDTKALKQGWKSLNDMKSKRYGGNESVSSSSEHERSTSDAKIASSVMKQSSSMPPYQSVSSSSRTELRRSRSITRSTDAIPPSSSSTRASSTPRMVPTTSPVRRGGVSSQENSMSRTPPRSTLRSSSALRSKIAVAGRTTAQEAPPGTNLLSSSNPTAPLSPLMKSSHKYRRNSGHVSTPHDVGARQQRSPSPVLRTGGSFGGGGGQQPHSPKRESIFQVLKPSKLASLSIAVLNKAVMPIQSLARVYIAKLRIENRKKNIVVMQSLIRRWHCRRYYKSVKTIALYFQGAFRGMVTRDQLDFRHYCASRIQAAFRGYLGSVTFFEILKSVILVQSLFRMTWQRRKYLSFMENNTRQQAATQIQSTFRRHRAQTEFLMDLTDVVVCQSAVRRFLAVRLKTQMKCATMIQATWRRFLASENYILILSDVIVCQSVVRRRIAVMNYNDTLARREVAAVSIQKVLRGFSARINYLLLLGDVVTIQSFVRRMIAMKELAILRQIQWSNEEVAATMIQAAYHGYNARVDYAIMKCQVIILQNAVRSMLARNELQTRRWIQRDKEEDAATKIQAAFHGYTARMDYVIVIGHVITLQTAVRSAAARNELRARRQNKAATKIRAAYIGFITRMNYLISLDSIIICQCAIRVMIAKRRLNEAQSMRVSLENAAATKLQSIFRGYAARIEYIITVSSIITCQAAVRMVLAKLKSFQLHKLQWEREDSAATLIRAAYLGYTARMNYLLTVADIITIQKYVRGHNARILANELILNQRLELIAAERERKSQENAAVRIQKIFRGFVAYEVAITSLANAIYLQANIRKFLAKIELERRRNNHRSVVRIQSVWRSHKAQTNYALVMYAIISIQSIHRRNLAMIKYENAQAQRSSAVVALQSCFRRHMVIARLNRYSEARAMYGARRLMNSEHWACTAIQKWWKQYLIQRNIAEAARESLEKSAATAIQKCFRGYRDCLQFVMMSFSIIQIQSVARSYSAKLHLKRLKREREEFELEQNDAATTIQACFRGYKDFVRFVLVQYFIIKIQSCARSYNARLHLKQKLMHEELKKQQRQEKAAALIIERFFITIKAEIDLEVSRMAMKKHRKQNVVSSNSSAVSQFNHAGNCIMTGGLDAHIMRGKSPARGRMPSYQSVASAPHESAESYRMRSNVPSVYAEHRETDQYPPHQGFRHTALSREQVIRSNGNLDHQRLDINHSHPTRPRRDMRSASPSREHAMPMQNGGHFPTSNCFVDHPHAPRVLQPGYAPQNDVSRDAVVHGGHGMLWAPSPPTPNYDSRGPTINPPLCNGNLPQPHVHNAYHDANIQGSNSFSSASHTNQMQSQYYSAHVEPQARLSPVPQTYYLAGVPNRSQQYLSKPPVQNTYPGHQRYLPTQNRSTHSRHVSNIE